MLSVDGDQVDTGEIDNDDELVFVMMVIRLILVMTLMVMRLVVMRQMAMCLY